MHSIKTEQIKSASAIDNLYLANHVDRESQNAIGATPVKLALNGAMKTAALTVATPIPDPLYPNKRVMGNGTRLKIVCSI
jgi:hypothetical protein